MKNEAKNPPLNIAETKKLAESLLEQVAGSAGLAREGALVVGLYGDLGAGKTTFMQFFGASLGITEKILSPTFVIEKIYKIDAAAAKSSTAKNFDHLIHIDAYRLESPNEMRALGWDEIVKDPRNIICVEWADKIAELLPADMVRLEFSHHDEESRHVILKKAGAATSEF